MHSFGLSVLGLEFVDSVVDYTDNLYVDTTKNADVCTYLRNKKRNCLRLNSPTQTDDLNFRNLREFDLKAQKKIKRAYRHQTVIINWPDKIDENVEIIYRLKPEFLCVIIDLNDYTGSIKLRCFLDDHTDFSGQKDAKYKTLLKRERVCIHFNSGETCTVVGVLFGKEDAPECIDVENYNPLILFSPEM